VNHHDVAPYPKPMLPADSRPSPLASFSVPYFMSISRSPYSTEGVMT
jgi:hypothetical protein